MSVIGEARRSSPEFLFGEVYFLAFGTYRLTRMPRVERFVSRFVPVLVPNLLVLDRHKCFCAIRYTALPDGQQCGYELDDSHGTGNGESAVL